MDPLSYYSLADQNLDDFVLAAKTLFETADLDTWKSLSSEASEPGALDSILHSAKLVLSGWSAHNPGSRLGTSTIFETLTGRTADLAETPTQEQIAVAKAVSDALRHMRLNGGGKASTLFELELVTQVCRDLSVTPGWGKGIMRANRMQLKRRQWGLPLFTNVYEAIQIAVPTIVRRHADAALCEVLLDSEYPQQARFEKDNFGKIWLSTQRIRDWMALNSGTERNEAVATLLMTCRSFLWDIAQGKLQGAPQPGELYHINETWRRIPANNETKYEQLDDTQCEHLMPLATEWFRLCGQ